MKNSPPKGLSATGVFMSHPKAQPHKVGFPVLYAKNSGQVPGSGGTLCLTNLTEDDPRTAGRHRARSDLKSRHCSDVSLKALGCTGRNIERELRREGYRHRCEMGLVIARKSLMKTTVCTSTCAPPWCSRQYMAPPWLEYGSSASCLPPTGSQYHTTGFFGSGRHVLFLQPQSVRPPGQMRLRQLVRLRIRGTQVRAVVLTAFPNLQNIQDDSKAMVTFARHRAHIKNPSLVMVNRRCVAGNVPALTPATPHFHCHSVVR